MPQRNDFSKTSAIAMHCRAHEFRCSTKVMSISPARSVNFTARSSSKVQPFPPHPVVIASFQTAATFSRSDLSLIFFSQTSPFFFALFFFFFFNKRKKKLRVFFSAVVLRFFCCHGGAPDQ